MLSFKCTPNERAFAEMAVMRFREFYEKQNSNDFDQQHWLMNIIAVHVNGCPLDWKKLHSCDDITLAHDFYGIEAHLNKNTGELEGCFIPRCAA